MCQRPQQQRRSLDSDERPGSKSVSMNGKASQAHIHPSIFARHSPNIPLLTHAHTDPEAHTQQTDRPTRNTTTHKHHHHHPQTTHSVGLVVVVVVVLAHLNFCHTALTAAAQTSATAAMACSARSRAQVAEQQLSLSSPQSSLLLPLHAI